MLQRSAASFEQALAEVQVLLNLPYPERDALRRELLSLASESPLEPAEYIRSLSAEKLTEIAKGL